MAELVIGKRYRTKEAAAALGISTKLAEYYLGRARKWITAGTAGLLGVVVALVGSGCVPMKPNIERSTSNVQLRTGKLSEVAGEVRAASTMLPGRTVTLAWDNEPAAIGTPYLTGLESSADLAHWSEIWRGDYGTGGPVRVTLSNRPPIEFYRAYNRLK